MQLKNYLRVKNNFILERLDGRKQGSFNISAA